MKRFKKCELSRSRSYHWISVSALPDDSWRVAGLPRTRPSRSNACRSSRACWDEATSSCDNKSLVGFTTSVSYSVDVLDSLLPDYQRTFKDDLGNGRTRSRVSIRNQWFVRLHPCAFRTSIPRGRKGGTYSVSSLVSLHHSKN